MIKKIGYIPVPEYLIDIVEARQPGEHNCFVAGVEIPRVYSEFADAHGFEIQESMGDALLFSSQVGVGQHYDEQHSLIWVLCGTNSQPHGNLGNHSHELLCDGAVQGLEDGYVYLVDTSKPHAVVATNHELWAVVSMYVSKEA